MFCVFSSNCCETQYVYVTKIAPGGLADTEGSMKPGDQIVSVSGGDVLCFKFEIANGCLLRGACVNSATI